MKRWLWAALAVTGAGASARVLDQCGIYEGEGQYVWVAPRATKGKARPALVLEAGSNSELRMFLAPAAALRSVRPGTYVQARFRLRAACDYDCEIESVRVLKSLAPSESPRPFLKAGLAPQNSEPCEARDHKIKSTP